MIFCNSPILELWQAPPNVDFQHPPWTKLIAGGVVLSNSIERADWLADPVQAIVCDHCGLAMCARIGLARIVRLADYLLWLPPRLPDVPDRRRGGLSEMNLISATVMMRKATWDSLRERFPNLPASEYYPQAIRRDLGQVWLGEMPAAVRVKELNGLTRGLREVLASNPLDLDRARELIQRTVGWVIQGLDEPVHGQVATVQECGGAINTFYFDGPPFSEWPAFVMGRDNSFVLGEDFVFIPDEVGSSEA